MGFKYIPLFIAVIILILVSVAVVNIYHKGSINNLRKKYILLHGGFSKEEASRALDRQILLLQKTHPQKDTRWYIEKAIYDLEKDRRVSR